MQSTTNRPPDDTSGASYVPAPVGRPDPRALGCKCDVCPLGKHLRTVGQWLPVLSEVHPGSCAVLAEAPGEREVTEGRPLVGRSGQEVMRALNALGVYRPNMSYGNAICCRPPDNDWKLFHYRHVDKPNARIAAENRRIAKENRELRKAGLPLKELKPLVPTPTECCRPQLLQQIERTPNLIIAGVTAYYAVTGKRKSIRKIRGSFNDYWLMANEFGERFVMQASEGWQPGQPVQMQNARFIHHLRIIPTLHPAFVLRSPAWRPVFQADVSRFFRWLNGKLQWTPPRVIIAPSMEELRAFLWDPNIPFHATDVETDGLEVLDLGWTKEDQEEGFRWANASLKERKGPWKPEYAATSEQRRKTPLPKVAQFRCIQIGAPDGRAMVVPLRSVDGVGQIDRWYPGATGPLIIQTLKDFFTDPKRAKVGHNHLYFDNAMFAAEFKIRVANLTDTMVLFRGAASELRRDLYTLGTFYTDVPDWKTGGDDRNVSVKPRSDRELHVYGAIDVHVTAKVVPPLLAAIEARGVSAAMRLDHDMSHIAREMKALGIGRVNETKRAALEEDLVEKSAKYRAALTRLAGNKWNPRSMADMTTLFVDDWGLAPLTLTATGEPSWDDATLRAYRQSDALTKDQRDFIDIIRAFRTVDKQLGTYVRPWRRWNDYRRTSTGRLLGGKVGPDGRLHPDFNVTAPKTGRISSSNPNCQNVIDFLRALIEPEDGHIYVGADYDQIELRLVAALAGLSSYLNVFAQNGDPHSVTSLLIYGKTFEEALKVMLSPKQWAKFKATGVPEKPEDARESALKFDKLDPEGSFKRCAALLRTEGAHFGSEQEARDAVSRVHRLSKMYKELRTFAKSFVYAVIYGGTANTVYQVVSAAEDPKTGKLLFPDMQLPEIRKAYNAFMSNAPELKAWWEATWEFARRNGYVAEAITGYRRDFPEFERNEILNLPVQGTAAKVMSIGMCSLRKRLAPGQFGPNTGIVAQVHDFGMVEVPIALGDWAQQQIEESFTMRFPQLRNLPLSSSGKKAINWMEA